MNPDGFSTIRFSTADLPEKDRVAMWREHYGRMSMKLDIEPINAAPLECAILIRVLPGVQIMSTAMSPSRITRTREFLADGNGDLTFIINQSGSVVTQSRGRDVVLREGDAVLMSTGEVKVFDRPVHGGSLSFRIPRSILSAIVPDVDDVVMQLIPQKTEALKLLAGYAAPLFNDIALATPDFRRTAVNHLHDLVALALGSAHDAIWPCGRPRRTGRAAPNGQSLHHRKQQSAGSFGWRRRRTPRLDATQSAATVRRRGHNVFRISALAEAESCPPHAHRTAAGPERGRRDRL